MSLTNSVWVLIPAHRPALGLLQEAIQVLGETQILVVTNGLHPITEHETNTPVLHDRTEGVNISRWWNLGLDWIEKTETKRNGDIKPHHVLILNADARIAPEGVAKLSWALDHHPAARMAGPKRGLGIVFEHRPEAVGLEARVPGWCHMIRGDERLRYDEQFRWWFSDDDLEWRCRRDGGTMLVGHIEARHLGDGMPKGELLELAKADRWKFQEKWGSLPW